MDHPDGAPWAPSVYYAASVIRSTLEHAWQRMVDYQAWNPSFAGAQVTLVAGTARSEGETVLIQKSLVDAHGNPWPQFYAKTVKLLPPRRLVWYLYPKEGDALRNFVDFSLTEVAEGVRFNIDYYAQNRLSGEALLEERKAMQTALDGLAAALKRHCETES